MAAPSGVFYSILEESPMADIYDFPPQRHHHHALDCLPLSTPSKLPLILILPIRVSIGFYFNDYTNSLSPFPQYSSIQPRHQKMAVPDVDKKLLMELQSMGFPLARATRALHYSGNSSLEDAVTWIIDHENDPDIDQMPLIPMDIDIDSPGSFDVTQEVKFKAEELRNGGHKPREVAEKEQGNEGNESREERNEELRNIRKKSREDREKELEREREKERRQSGKQFLEAKKVAEENARKRMSALREAEKAEERRARERIRQKLEADKAERRSRHGLLPDVNGSVRSNESDIVIPAVPSQPKSATNVSATRAELLSESLRTLKRSCMGDDAKAKRAFQTIHVYVRNVISYPDQPKYRRIRLTNPVFLERIGSLRGGTRFLELCGFERATGSQFLYLPRNKVDMAVLNAAMSSLQSALTNPFFGLLSTELPENSSNIQ